MDDTDNGIERQHTVNPEKAPEKARKTKPRGYWKVRANVEAAALKYDTITAFQRGCSAAYHNALWGGYLYEIVGHMPVQRTFWTEQKCVESAQGYAEITPWAKACSGAYNAAIRHGWKDACTAHMTPYVKPRKYTLSDCVASAAGHQNSKSWQLSDPRIYDAAVRYGYLEECCGHMNRAAGGYSDGDAVYVWRAVGHVEWGLRLYKMGATSAKLGDQRINQVARRCGMTPAIKALTPVRGCAFELEAKLLQLGKHPHWLEGDGRTEFRALTTAELDLALDMIAQAAA